MLKKISHFILRVRLLVFVLFSGFAFSQTPGGITATDLRIEYWLRADNVSSTLPVDGADVTTWEDQSPFRRNFNNDLATTYRFYPRFKKSAMNFHSAVNFYYDSNISSANNSRRKLLSRGYFYPEAGRSYFTIWVSRIDKTYSNTMGTIISLNSSSATGTNDNSYGWYNSSTNTSISHSTKGTDYNYAAGLGKNYGIGITVVPNNTTTPQKQYIDAKVNPATLAGRTMETSASMSTLGTISRDTGYNDTFFGDIMEVVVISVPGAGNVLSDQDLKKINSHFAIKYGITLDASQADYVLSDDTVIYNRSNSLYSSYNKAIIGIARDDASGLYQKQSVSSDDNFVTVYLDALKETNAENTGVLADKQAVMFGSNGLSGSTVYLQDANTTFSAGSLGVNDKLTHRLNKILKVKLTGITTPYDVNFKFSEKQAEWLLVSSDEAFTPSNTRIYKITDGKATARINDGDYISYAFKLATPGGILSNGLEVEYWLKANEVSNVLPADGADVTLWEDKSPNARNFTKHINSLAPRFLKNSSYNFNSAVDFYSAGGNKHLQTGNVFNIVAGRTYYIIHVSKLDNASQEHGTIINLDDGSPYDGQARFGWIKSTGRLEQRLNAASLPNPGRPYGIGIYKMGGNSSYSANGTIEFYQDGQTVFTRTGSYGFMSAGINKISVLGGDDANTATSSYYFYGLMNEVIVLSTPDSVPLTSTDLAKVNSYLALKYGLTLDSAQAAYIMSNGATTYDITANGYTTYNKDIFGLIRDDEGGIYQKQSKSTLNPVITAYVGDLAETNAENTGTLVNNTALVFGANGTIKTNSGYNPTIQNFVNFNSSILNPNRYSDRITRIVDYKLRAKTTGQASFTVNLFSEISVAEWVVVGSDQNFAPGMTRIYRLNDNIATNVVINDGDYIGYAFDMKTPGGINTANLNMEYWLRADEVSVVQPNNGDEVKYWRDMSSSARDFNNTETNPAYPFFTKSSMNFHSAVDFSAVQFNDDGTANTTEQNTFNQRRKLLSIDNFAPESNRAYAVIWVSKVDAVNSRNGSSSYATVFGLNSSTTSGSNGNEYGWNITGTADDPNSAIAHRTSGTWVSGLNGVNYGIGMALLPNSSTSTWYQHQYFNALVNSGNITARAMQSASSKSVLGTSAIDTGYEDYFFGEVMEVIVISLPQNATVLSATEINQINTHLAIKYGISLDVSQTKYLLSDALNIYDSSLAGYEDYNNFIFGIARDDKSGLYQKQSTNTDNPVATVYLDELKETNAENLGVLEDRHALVFGSTNKATDTDYVQVANASGSTGVFRNYTLRRYADPNNPGEFITEKINKLSKYELKAKITGQMSMTVKLRPGIGEWVLRSQTSSTFNPAQTDIYRPGSDGFVTLTIQDGDYIGFAFDVRGPGGVTDGLKMWLNASKYEETMKRNSANEVINWSDYSGNGVTYRQRNSTGSNAGAPLFLLSDERTNFHPTPYFRKWQDALITNKSAFSVIRPVYSAVYGVVNHNLAVSDRTYFISFGSLTTATNARRPAFGVYRGSGSDALRGYGRIATPSYLRNSGSGTDFMFNSGATTIAGFNWYNNASGTNTTNNKIDFNFDAKTKTVANVYYGNATMNGPGMLGLGSSSNSYHLDGIMPEVIAYERQLPASDQDKINSYLGLKYAITLRKGLGTGNNNFNYTFSDGTTLWDGNVVNNASFHNNIAAIIKDNSSELHNKQARSTDVGAIVHMGIGTKLGTDANLGRVLEDKSALIWGHNNGDLTPITYTSSDPNNQCGLVDEVLGSRVWLAQKTTNFNQKVMLAAYGSDFPFNAAYYEVYLVIADNPDKLSGTTKNWDQIIPMSFVNDMHVANYLFTNPKTYFSFAAKKINGNCESCDFAGVKKLEFTNATWPRPTGTVSTISRSYPLLDGFNVKVEVQNPDNKLYRGYPRSSTQKSLRETRRGGGVVKTIVSFDKDNVGSIAASTFFEIYDIDRIGVRLDDVQIIGYCGGVPVNPVLSYADSRPLRSKYTIISANQAKAKSRGVAYNGATGYTNKLGRLYVDFEYPVERIEIIYTTDPNNQTGIKYLGIGKMEFYCPAPLPPPNVDGLIFTKQGTDNLLTCEEVNYTFRAVNTNCADKTGVTFVDELPSGMLWSPNSFSAAGLDIPDGNITGYGTRTLTVTGLTIPGGGDTFTMRANAYFDTNATTGNYENRATLSGQTITSISSVDRLTGQNNTITHAVAPAGAIPQKVQTSLSLDKSCIKENQEYVVTLTITNPNTSAYNFTDMSLALNYESQIFTFKPGSLVVSSNINMTNVITNESTIVNDQMLLIDGFTLPAASSSTTPSVATIKYTVTSAALSSGAYDYTSLTPLVVPKMSFGYDLETTADGECLESAFTNATADIDVAYCTYCVKDPVGGTPLNSKVGISVMKDYFSGWPENVPNGYMVLEAGKKGMVLTRVQRASITDPKQGMVIYDTTADANCISIYNGTTWKCIERSCNE